MDSGPQAPPPPSLSRSGPGPELSVPPILAELRDLLDYIARLEAELRGERLQTARLRTERDAYLAHWEAAQKSQHASKPLQAALISNNVQET